MSRCIGARGKMFNGDAPLPLKHPTTQAATPSYQVYVVLAWLLRLGAVKLVGPRAGHSLNESKPPEATFTAAWPELLEWQV